MSKVLIITTTSGFLSQFELNNVKLLQERGYQVHYATNFGVPVYEVKDDTLRNMGVVLHHISIEKNPFKIKKNIPFILAEERRFPLLSITGEDFAICIISRSIFSAQSDERSIL